MQAISSHRSLGLLSDVHLLLLHCPPRVTHPGTNRARRRATSLWSEARSIIPHTALPHWPFNL